MNTWKCTVCSYVYAKEEKPEKCPACGAEPSMMIAEHEDPSQEVTAEKKVDSSPPVKNDDAPAGRKWKCTICNYIHTGEEPPEKCPVCGADASFFIEVPAAGEQADTADSQEQTTGQAPADTQQAAQKKSDAELGLLWRLVVKHHLHPISVHTPNGVIPIALLFVAGAILFSSTALDLAALFNMIAVLLAMPPVIATGYVAWRVKYKGAMTSVFKTKFICALIVAVGLTLMICWRLIQQDIAIAGSTSAYVYLILGVVVLAAAGISGHLGGKLVFERE